MKDVELGVIATAEKECKCITSGYLARHLLRAGNPIIDIKENKREGREGQTVFVFEVTDKFKKDLESIKEGR